MSFLSNWRRFFVILLVISALPVNYLYSQETLPFIFHYASEISTIGEPPPYEGAAPIRSSSESLQNYFTLEIDSQQVEAMLQRFQGDPSILQFEPNYPIESSSLPADPLFLRWESFYNYDLMEMDQAWELSNSCEEVLVAVLDSGIEQDHPDLIETIWHNPNEIADNGRDDDDNGYIDDVQGYDFYSDDADPNDLTGHGTEVSGIIGAVAGNDTGLSGICWKAQILPLKIFGKNGEGPLSAALEAIDYAIARKVRIINMSWALKSGGRSEILEKVIKKGKEKGIFFVTAAGNDGKNLDQDPVYPASYDLPNLIAVAAHDEEGRLADFSNYGNSSVLIAAPGVDVLTTGLGNRYVKFSGTSAATPHASGVAALLLALNPNLSPSRLKTLFLDQALPEENLSGQIHSGGRLSALKLLQALNVDSDSQEEGLLSADPANEEDDDNNPPDTLAAGGGGGCSLVHAKTRNVSAPSPQLDV
ncbi:MAG: S8 family serine peptidase [Deltaproteobacteria bacterium]|nr:S8 family serine peptidase [Deltaproteobacteria bacterium]